MYQEFIYYVVDWLPSNFLLFVLEFSFEWKNLLQFHFLFPNNYEEKLKMIFMKSPFPPYLDKLKIFVWNKFI